MTAIGQQMFSKNTICLQCYLLLDPFKQDSKSNNQAVKLFTTAPSQSIPSVSPNDSPIMSSFQTLSYTDCSVIAAFISQAMSRL